MEVSNLNDLVRRISSILIDHILLTILVVLLGFILAMIFKLFEVSDTYYALCMITTGGLFYFCKDIFNGQSYGKKFMKIRIVNDQDGEPVGNLKSIIRNVFILIWAIEIIMIFINSEKRLGDMVVNTHVIYEQ